MTRLSRTILGLVFIAMCIPWFISNPYGRIKDAGAEYLGVFLDTYGLDTIYTGTVVMNLVMLSYWKDIKNWDKLDFGSKCMIVPAGFFAFICNLWSFFKLIGIMPF